MNRRKERFVETFILGMFPVALFVGCTTSVNESNVAATARQIEQANVEQVQILGLEDLGNLKFEDGTVDKGKDMAIMQFAVYKSDDSAKLPNPAVKTVKFKDLPGTSPLKKFVFHFESGEYNLSRTDLDELAAHADFLRSHPTFSVTVGGHTDHVGPEQRNLELSKQRARFIAEILMTYGVDEAQVTVEGFGESVPLHAKQNLRENRRVELEYSETMLMSSM